MTENEVTQALIQYCPVCGYKSKKAFEEGEEDGGHWTCENCNEVVEAYILDRRYLDGEGEDDDSDDGSGMGGGIIFAVVIMGLLSIIYFIFK